MFVHARLKLVLIFILTLKIMWTFPLLDLLFFHSAGGQQVRKWTSQLLFWTHSLQWTPQWFHISVQCTDLLCQTFPCIRLYHKNRLLFQFNFRQQCRRKGTNNFNNVQFTNLFCVVRCKSLPRRFRTVSIFSSVFGTVGLAYATLSKMPKRRLKRREVDSNKLQ